MTPAEVTLIRAQMALSRAEFAKLVDVAPVTVFRWETGERPVSKPYPRIIRAVAQGIRLPE